MIRTIYVAAKPGEERMFPAMSGFSPEATEELVRNGYWILEVPILMPPGFAEEPTVYTQMTLAKRIR